MMFIVKLWDIVNDPTTNEIIQWSKDGSLIEVIDVPKCIDILPRYFKHSNINSFIRQLNTYGFKKISSVNDNYKRFFNKNFHRDRHDKLKNAASWRKRPKSTQHSRKRSSNYFEKELVKVRSIQNNLTKHLLYMQQVQRDYQDLLSQLYQKQTVNPVTLNSTAAQGEWWDEIFEY